MAAQNVGEGLRPQLGTANAGYDHEGAGNEETFSRTIDEAEVERVSVVRLPCREVHGNTRAQRGEDTRRAGSQSEGGCFEQTGECAVERVNAVVKEFAEAARGSGSASLLAINIVHGLVHEEAKSEAKVQPSRSLELLLVLNRGELAFRDRARNIQGQSGQA